MRLKNVKNASDIIKASTYVVQNPEKYKGKWNELFNNTNPINVEIGMGKGNFIIGMAKKYPSINFIGIEMFDSVIVRAAQKLEDEKIDNLKLIRMDANKIEDVFCKEIDTVYLNFSDPWPKKRHTNRRLTSHVLLSKYDYIFKNECKIVQKTDNVSLFEFSICSLSSYGYILDEINLDLTSLNDDSNVLTEYESKFVTQGVKIMRLKAHKDK